MLKCGASAARAAIGVSTSIRPAAVTASRASPPLTICLWQTGPLMMEAVATPHLHLELHAMDLVDPSADGLEHLVGVQPGLKVPLSRRRERLVELLRAREGGHPIESVLA